VISAVVKKENVNTVVHFRISHNPETGFSIPGSDPQKTLYKLLQTNSQKFKYAQAPEQSKYKFLTTLAMLRDSGYDDAEEGLSVTW